MARVLDLDAGLPGSPYFSAPHVADPQMAAAFSRLSDELLATGSESLRNETLMRAFLTRMLTRHGERPHAVVTAPLSAGLARLARVKDYSRAHLTRAFGAAYHIPPHVYLNAVRVAKAQTLIRLGMPLAAVALECGFSDQSHFTRRFKGSVGVSPSDWRGMTSRASGFIR